MSSKMELDFSELEQYQKRLEQLAGGEAVEKAVNGALEQAQHIVARNLNNAMMNHIETGETKDAIIDNEPTEWTGGTVASIGVGFRISQGGLPSIFLMYGTKVHGQPHIQPDRNLYNAIYGAQVRKEVLKIQTEAFEKAIDEVMK